GGIDHLASRRPLLISGRQPMPTSPPLHHCEECSKIARALRVALQADTRELRTRARDVAVSTGRELRQFSVVSVFSVAAMPDNKLKTSPDSHSPRVAEASRLRDAHETATGHSLKAWWVLSQYGLDR